MRVRGLIEVVHVHQAERAQVVHRDGATMHLQHTDQLLEFVGKLSQQAFSEETRVAEHLGRWRTAHAERPRDRERISAGVLIDVMPEQVGRPTAIGARLQ